MTITVAGSQITFNDSTVQTTAARGGATTTTSAVDITLTSSSNQMQLISMTATGKYVILPDATTLGKSTTGFVICSVGPCAFGIKDGAGNILVQAASGIGLYGGMALSLIDNATSAGKWTYSSVGEYVFGNGTPNVSTISTAGVGAPVNCVALSSTQALIFYSTAASNSLVVVLATVSGSTVTFGTPVTIFSATYSNNSLCLSAVALSSTSAAVFSTNGSTSVFGWAISVSGSTVTVGTATNTGMSPGGVVFELSALADTSTTGVLAAATGTPAVSVVAFSVSGTTISFGTAANSFITASATSVSAMSLARSAANTYVVLVAADGVSDLKHRAFSVSGTTLTLGTTTTTDTGNGNFSSNLYTYFSRVWAAGGSGWVSYVGYALTYSIQYSGTTYVGGSVLTQPNGIAAPNGPTSAVIGSANYALSAQVYNSGMYINVTAPYAGGANSTSPVYFNTNTVSSTTAGVAALDSSTFIVATKQTVSSTIYVTAQVYKLNF